MNLEFFGTIILRIFQAMVLTGMLASAAQASPSLLTYQGRIIKPDGSPLEYSNVSFIFQIANPSGQCVIYQELVTGINLTNSKGVFDVPIGAGSVTWPNTGSFSILDAFNNNASFVCGACAGYSCSAGSSSYSPLGTHGRVLRVQFHDGQGWKQISPDNLINTVPYAGYALAAQKLGAHNADAFILKNEINDNLSCDGINGFLTWDAATHKFTCTGVTGSAGGTVTNVTSANSYLGITQGTTAPILTLNVGTTAGTVAAGNDTRLVNALQSGEIAGGDLNGAYPNPTVAALKGIEVAYSTLSSGQVLRYSGGNWVNASLSVSDIPGLSTALGNSLTHSQLPASCSANQTLTFMAPTGAFSCSPIALDGSQVTGDIAGKALGFTDPLAGDVSGLQGATVVDKIKGVPVVATVPTANQILKFNGAAWAPASLSGADLPGDLLSGNGTAGYLAYFDDSRSLSDSVIFQGSGRVGIGTNNPQAALDIYSTSAGFLLPRMTNSQRNALASPTAGLQVYNTTTNQLNYYDGTAWQVVGAGGGGGGGSLTLNGQSGSTQVFDVGSAGLAPTITSSADVHTLDIPLASGVGVMSGTISKSDYDIFAAKLGPNSSFGGDVSGTYDTLSVDRIKGMPVDFTAAPTPGQALKFDGSNWVAGSVGVTSLTVGTGLSGGTITGTGNIGLGAPLLGLHNIATNGFIQRTGAGTYSTTVASSSATASTLVQRDSGGQSSFQGIGLTAPNNESLILKSDDMTASYSLIFPSAQGAANQVMVNDGAGVLTWANVPAAPAAACVANNVLTFDGTDFICVPDQMGSAGGGIATFNGLNASSQSLAIGTTGTAPTWSSTAGVHTLHIPLASAAGVTAGLLSRSAYDTFNAKLGFATVFAGDVSGVYNNTSVNKIKGVSVSTTAPSAEGQVLRYNGTSEYAVGFLSLADIRSTVNAANTMFPASSCSTGQTLTWSSLTDTMTCSSIALNANQLTAGTLLAARMPAFTGDVTSTAGSLTLTIPDGTITSAKIANGAIVDEDIAAVSVAKVTNASGAYFAYRPNNVACTNGQTLIWNNTNSRWMCGTPSEGTVTLVDSGTGLIGGPITSSGTLSVDVGTTANKILQLNGSAQIPAVSGALLTSLNATNLTSGTVNAARLPAFTGGDVTSTAGTVVLSIGNNAITTAKIADNAVTTAKINTGAVTANELASNAVITAKIADNAVTTAKINTGAVTANELASNAVTTVKIADNAVTTAKINTGAVTANELASNAVTTVKIVDNAVTSAKIATGAVTATELGSNAVTTVKIADNAVTTAKINTGAVTATELGSNAVTTVKIADNAVTSAKIASSAVTATELATGAVTSAKILDNTIAEADLNANLTNRIWAGGNGTNIYFSGGNAGFGTSSPAAPVHIATTPDITSADVGGGLIVGPLTALKMRIDSNEIQVSNAAGEPQGIMFNRFGGTIAFGDDIVPASGTTANIGSSSRRWTTVYATNGTISTSDGRLKKDIEDLKPGLDFILSLRPVSYKWKEGESKTHWGFIAQELKTSVDEYQPEDNGVVSKNGGEYYGVNYSELVSPIIKALGELYAKWFADHQRIDDLEKENKELKARLEAQAQDFEKRLQRLEQGARAPASE